MKGELQQQIDFSLRILFPILSFLNLISQNPNNIDGALRNSEAFLFINSGKAWIQKCGRESLDPLRCDAL